MAKQYQIGEMIYFGKRTFTIARRLFGGRWFLVHKGWSVYKHLLGTHFRGVNRKGQKFVYCPISLLVSWHTGDYDEKWCHACQKYFTELEASKENRT